MLEPPAREQHAGLDQRLDHRLVGVALLALVGEDALAGEAGRLIGEAAVGVDGVGNGGVDACARKLCARSPSRLEVFAAVPGSGVDETGTGVVGDMIARQAAELKFVMRHANPLRGCAQDTSEMPPS